MKLAGTVTFLMEGDFQQRAAKGILRANGEVAFDFDYGEPGQPLLYNVVLRPTQKNQLEGEFVCGRGADAISGPVNCRVYKNDSGFALVGRWIEDGHIDQW